MALRDGGRRSGELPDLLHRRESGSSPHLLISRRLFASRAFLKRMDVYTVLFGHKGCVNTVSFNLPGDLLISGSDDRNIILWDWVAKCRKLTYPSGHLDNVFQARIMPFTNDCSIITSSADGQVRVGQLKPDGEVSTKQLGSHCGRVHKLAIKPGIPHIFYSCGEDGLVQHFDLRSQTSKKLFFTPSSSVIKDFIQLNAIVVDPRNPNYFAVGGSDQYARVYDIRNYQSKKLNCDSNPVNTFCPQHLLGARNVQITGLAYSNASELLVSYNDELIYLFEKGMGLGPIPRSSPAENLDNFEQPQVYSGHRNSRTIKGVSFFGPSDEYVVSGSDCGHIYMWKKRNGELLRMMRGDTNVVNCVEPHPCSSFLASSGFAKAVKIWSPTGDGESPLPPNAPEIMTSNKHSREVRAGTRVTTLSSEVMMHVLRLQRRQSALPIERRRSASDADSDENDDAAFILRLSNDLDADTRECITS